MGVYAFLDLAECYVRLMQLNMYSKLCAGLMFPPLLMMIIGFLCFLHYTFSDTVETRKRLVPACALMVFANVWEIVIFIVAVCIVDVMSAGTILE